MTLDVQENTEDIEEILSKLNDDSILHTPGAIFVLTTFLLNICMLCRVYPMMLPFSVLYFDWSRHVVVLLVYVDFMIHNDFLYTVSSFSVNSTLSGILGQAVEGMYTYTYNLQFRIQIWGLYLGTLSSLKPQFTAFVANIEKFWTFT